MSVLKAVLFDMDGTLTQPLIDWRQVRRQLDVPEGASIMDHIQAQEGARRDQAEQLLKRLEYEAAVDARANEGAVEVVERLRQHGLKTGLVTNNHRRAMARIVDRLGLRFDLLLSREDGVAKPAPDLLMLALERLEVEHRDVLFVGDGRYDRAASSDARIPYVHLEHDVEAERIGPTIHSLTELWQLVEPLMDPDCRQHPL